MSGPPNYNAQVSSFRALPNDGTMKPYPGASFLADKMRKSSAGPIHGILIGMMQVPGYKAVRNEKGIIAVLIGLLLPAVRQLNAGSAEVQLLKSGLASGGAVGLAMGDGSVRTVIGGSGFRFQGLPGECDWIIGRELEEVWL